MRIFPVGAGFDDDGAQRDRMRAEMRAIEDQYAAAWRARKLEKQQADKAISDVNEGQTPWTS